jgi:hypothetical protein
VFVHVISQITERLDKCSEPLTDLYPILGPATLSVISEGMLLVVNRKWHPLIFRTAVLGCSARDLGEAFVDNNERVM